VIKQLKLKIVSYEHTIAIAKKRVVMHPVFAKGISEVAVVILILEDDGHCIS